MSRVLIIVSLVLTCGLGFSQGNNNKHLTDDHEYFVGHNMVIPRYHHRVELEGLKKSTLVHLYVKRVRIFEELLPFTCVKAGPRMTMLELNIPESKKNQKILAKHYKAKTKHLDALEEDLARVVNFSDKETIVEAIIIIESAIWQIQKYRDGDMHHEEVH